MDHPANAEAWEWDEGNESELANHGVRPAEVEAVFTNGPKWARNRRYRAGDWKMIGYTHGGRRLTVVVRYDSARRWLRPITGWDSTVGECSRYFDG
jgi:uncharacterized DUF497 family protein